VKNASKKARSLGATSGSQMPVRRGAVSFVE